MRWLLAICLLACLAEWSTLSAQEPKSGASRPEALAASRPGNVAPAKPVRPPLQWKRTLDDELTPAQKYAHRVIVAVTYGWFFAIGACIGSFANVVVYRAPRGLSVFWPPSRCSTCEQPVRLADNVPIFSWLWLGGRCRHCCAPFSIRYMLVELLFGLTFLAFGHWELLSGGASLAYRAPNTYTGPVWILWSPQWELILLVLFHLGMVSHLFVLALVQWDGLRLPRLNRWGVVTTALLLPVFLPFLHTGDLWQDWFFTETTPAWAKVSFVWSHSLSAPRWFYDLTGAATLVSTVSLDELAVGLAGAVLCGLLSWGCARMAGLSTTAVADSVHVSVIVGAMLGWQGGLLSTSAGSLVMLVLAVVTRLASRASFERKPAAAWAIAVPLSLLAWEPLRALTSLADREPDPVGRLLLAAGALLCAGLTRLIARTPMPEPVDEMIPREPVTADREPAAFPVDPSRESAGVDPPPAGAPLADLTPFPQPSQTSDSETRG
jgi:prepilin signal peptidase PulO-like enzyme (type II secretory pathway)